MITKALLGWTAAGATLAAVILLTPGYSSGPLVHFIMEAAGSLLAVTVALLAVQISFDRKDHLSPYVATAFFTAGAADQLHALLAIGVLVPPAAELSRFIPGTWEVSRSALLGILLFGVWFHQRRPNHRPSVGVLTLTIVCVIGGGIVLFAFRPLPVFIFEAVPFVHRPGELPALVLTVEVLRRLRKQPASPFTTALAPALVLGGLTQLVMSFSVALYGPLFDAAHLLKDLSYLAAAAGLLSLARRKVRKSFYASSAWLLTLISILGIGLEQVSMIGLAIRKINAHQLVEESSELFYAARMRRRVQVLVDRTQEHHSREEGGGAASRDLERARQELSAVLGRPEVARLEAEYQLDFSELVRRLHQLSENPPGQLLRSFAEAEILQPLDRIVEHEETEVRRADHDNARLLFFYLLGHIALLFVVLPVVYALAAREVRRHVRPLLHLTRAVAQTENTAIDDDTAIRDLGTDDELGVLVKSFNTFLRSEREQLRHFVDTANAPIFGVDASGRINEWNDTTVRITGFSRHEVMGANLVETRIAEDDRPAVKAVLQRALAGEGTANYELPLYTKAGERLLVLLNATTRRDEKNEIVGVWGVGQDITEREKTERRNRGLFENAPLMYVVTKVDHGEPVVSDCNARFLTVLGYERDQVLGKPLKRFYDPESSVALLVEGGYEEALAGRFKDEERSLVTSDGRIVETLLRALPDRNAFGEVTGTLAMYVDVTELNAYRRDLERRVEERTRDLADANRALEIRAEELRRSNTELEQFAYVASHDLQAPLRMVASYTQLLARRYRGKLDAEADEFIDFAVEGALRMQRLINDLLELSRLETRGEPWKCIRLDDAVDAALQSLGASIEESAMTLERAELPEVEADPAQLALLFQNLIGNAVKFSGGRPPHVEIGASSDGDLWVVNVKDRGIGIEERHLERIFRIFQRLHTKEEYPGTGIGLAICRKIVERHGGRIWAVSEPGEGSTFFFSLPKKAARHEQTEHRHPPG